MYTYNSRYLGPAVDISPWGTKGCCLAGWNV